MPRRPSGHYALDLQVHGLPFLHDLFDDRLGRLIGIGIHVRKHVSLRCLGEASGVHHTDGSHLGLEHLGHLQADPHGILRALAPVHRKEDPSITSHVVHPVTSFAEYEVGRWPDKAWSGRGSFVRHLRRYHARLLGLAAVDLPWFVRSVTIVLLGALQRNISGQRAGDEGEGYDYRTYHE